MTFLPRAVIFDFDGTILDTESREFQHWQLLYREHGRELALSDWQRGIGTWGGFDPWAGLPDDVQARLRQLAGRRFTRQGKVLIAAQRHRTQERNRQAALEVLIRLIRRAAEPPVQRVATRPTAASRRRRLQTKTHRACIKRTRAAPDEE